MRPQAEAIDGGVVLWLPGVPPRPAQSEYVSAHRAWQAAREHWVPLVAEAVSGLGYRPRWRKATVQCIFMAPPRRLRDPGNYDMTHIVNGLVYSQVLADDRGICEAKLSLPGQEMTVVLVIRGLLFPLKIASAARYALRKGRTAQANTNENRN